MESHLFRERQVKVSKRIACVKYHTILKGQDFSMPQVNLAALEICPAIVGGRTQ
jgi:hypothetical protein